MLTRLFLDKTDVILCTHVKRQKILSAVKKSKNINDNHDI